MPCCDKCATKSTSCCDPCKKVSCCQQSCCSRLVPQAKCCDQKEQVVIVKNCCNPYKVISVPKSCDYKCCVRPNFGHPECCNKCH